MIHEEYDKFFEPATVIQAEGARIGLCLCKICGSSILLDPRDCVNAARLHGEWHNRIDAALAGEKK